MIPVNLVIPLIPVNHALNSREYVDSVESVESGDFVESGGHEKSGGYEKMVILANFSIL